HDDFAVRNVGLPGLIGALGICFGKVVTMDSPRARPPGEFQWEGTLWHELAHVVTLQMSNQRLPRWLSEGISEYEEKVQRPDWARGMDVTFAAALNRGETMKLRDLNEGFTDPRKVSLAYFQASVVVEYIVRTFEDAGLHRLIRAYGQGKEGEAALKAALNVDFDELQVGFDRAVDERFGKMRRALDVPDREKDPSKMPPDELRAYAGAHQDTFPLQMALGAALRKAGQLDDAIAVFERAAKLVPLATGPQAPNAQIAEIALQKKDQARAIAALQAEMAVDFENIEAPRRLIALLRQTGVSEPNRFQAPYRRIVALDPFDAEARSAL